MCWQPDVEAHERYLDRLMKAYFNAFMEYANEVIDFDYHGSWHDARTIKEFSDDARRRVTKLVRHRNSGRIKSSGVDQLASVTVDWKRILGLDA